MTLGSILWFIAIGLFFSMMMRKGGGCCGGHDHGGHGKHDDQGKVSSDHEHETHGDSARLSMEALPGKDPVCGMEVDGNEPGPNSSYLGRTVRFCSDRCQKLFDLNPGKYMEHSHGAHLHH